MYPEVERQRALLRVLYDHIEAGDSFVVTIQRDDLVRFAERIGVSAATIDRLFARLLHEGYIIPYRSSNKAGSPIARLPNGEFLLSHIEMLSEKGLREIDELPSENAYEALIAGIENRIAEVRADDSLPEERKQRETGRWVTVLRTFAEIAGDVGPPVLGEVIKRSVGF